ncbi:glycosyltransferase family 4 protein [Solirhodobacter olei]|uniref:glycosyltransferase family 4 protein n=1 Tax=Solirhodobacter olei TaxID=2493082 RepID=UPI000FD8BF80|nr:glycosyltransferase family 4 protein [Solirhodobacter olei]
MDTGELSNVVHVPEHAGRIVRSRLGLSGSDPLRVTFVPGPGDVAGTFDYWRSGQHDPRVPCITYSLMFYELMTQLNAYCQIIAHHRIGDSAAAAGKRFRFDQVNERSAKGWIDRVRSRAALADEIVDLTNDFNPHVVVISTHAPKRSWQPLSRGRTLILSMHNTFWPMQRPPRTLKGRLRKAMLIHMARSLDGAICTSHECARQIAALTGGRFEAEVECPQILREQALIEPDAVRDLLFLGRIERFKGVFMLIDVFEQLAAAYPYLTLTLAGSGSADTAVTQRIAASPHRDKISFVGSLESEQVHAAIAAADLLICPTMASFNEGLALVGFEAASHGVPSVLSSVVPAADLLADSCVVYEADNPEALAAAMNGLIADKKAYRDLCAATASVRQKIFDRSLSWGSGLFNALAKDPTSGDTVRSEQVMGY